MDKIYILGYETGAMEFYRTFGGAIASVVRPLAGEGDHSVHVKQLANDWFMFEIDGITIQVYPEELKD